MPKTAVTKAQVDTMRATKLYMSIKDAVILPVKRGRIDHKAKGMKVAAWDVTANPDKFGSTLRVMFSGETKSGKKSAFALLLDITE